MLPGGTYFVFGGGLKPVVVVVGAVFTVGTGFDVLAGTKPALGPAVGVGASA
jgi:hypothetical protein